MKTKGVITQEEVKVYFIISIILLIIGIILLIASPYIMLTNDLFGFISIALSIVLLIEGWISVLCYFIYPGLLKFFFNRFRYSRIKKERSQ